MDSKVISNIFLNKIRPCSKLTFFHQLVKDQCLFHILVNFCCSGYTNGINKFKLKFFSPMSHKNQLRLEMSSIEVTIIKFTHLIQVGNVIRNNHLTVRTLNPKNQIVFPNPNLKPRPCSILIPWKGFENKIKSQRLILKGWLVLILMRNYNYENLQTRFHIIFKLRCWLVFTFSNTYPTVVYMFVYLIFDLHM